MYISRRDYFASTADVSWINKLNTTPAVLDVASDLSGIPVPNPITGKSALKFWIRFEIFYRWKFADLMHDGFDTNRT